METYLFYHYLKIAKENKQTFWPKLFSRPIEIVVFFILTLVSCIASPVFVILRWELAVIIALVFEMVFGALFYFLSERHRINFCDSEYGKYEEYCIKLLDSFKQLKIKEEDISEICGSVSKKIDSLKAEEDKSNAKEERWLQTLIIPTTIAIITAVIAKQNDIVNMLAYTFIIVVIFAVVYGLISIVRRFSFYPQKQRIEQMECFLSDLQSIVFFIRHK